MSRAAIVASCTVEKAKEIARNLLKTYGNQEKNEISIKDLVPMLSDTYKMMNSDYHFGVNDISEYFKTLDTDRDGKISLEDLETLCIKFFCGINETKIEKPKSLFIEEVLSDVENFQLTTDEDQLDDLPGERAIAQDRFKSFSLSRNSSPTKIDFSDRNSYESLSTGYIDIVRRVFNKYDQNGNGIIDYSEVNPIMEETYKIMGMSKPISYQVLDDYLKLTDVDSDGRITVNDFEALFMRSMERLGFLKPEEKSRTTINQERASEQNNSGYKKIVFSTPKKRLSKRQSSEILDTPPDVDIKHVQDAYELMKSNPNRMRKINLTPQNEIKIKNRNLSLLEIIRQLFKKFDIDNDNYIDQRELKYVLEETYAGLGVKKQINEDDVNHYMKFADSNFDGKLSLDEFERMILKSLDRWGGEDFIPRFGRNSVPSSANHYEL